MIGIQQQETRTCEIHGEYTSSLIAMRSLTHWSGCDKCAAIRDAERQEEERRQRIMREINFRIERSGIPLRFADRTLDNYDAQPGLQSEVLEFSKHYAANFAEYLKTGTSVMFLGLVGTGKTHLAIGILRAVIHSGNTGKYFTVSRIMRDVKDTFHKHAELSESEVLERLIKTDLLVIDEIGVHRANEFEANTLFEVINGRYEALKPTLLLANLNLREMRESVGDRVFDRMRENGGRAFVMDWKSNRGAKS